MRRSLYSAFILACMIALASPALAQPAGPAGGARGHMHGPGAAMGSGLTPDQQQTMQRITNAHQATFAKLYQRLWAKGTQLQAALTEDKIDEARVRSLAGEINKLRADLFNEQVAMQVELAKAGLAYHALRGRGMMGSGMMGGGMAGFCPMMGGNPDAGAPPRE
jgi:zinc resistance-associated protein